MQLDEQYREVLTGSFFINPARGGYPGEINMGNAEVVGWLLEVRTIEHINAAKGQADAVKQYPIARILRVIMDKSTFQHSELAFGVSAVNEAAGVSSEVIDEIVSMDGDHEDATGWHALVHGGGAKAPNVDVVCWSAAAKTGTQSIEGTDFYFDYALGRAARKDGGNITDGQDVYFSYKYTTQDAKVLNFADTKLNTKGRFRYSHELQDGSNTFVIAVPYGYVSEISEIADTGTGEDIRKIEMTIRSLRLESEAGKELGTERWSTS